MELAYCHLPVSRRRRNASVLVFVGWEWRWGNQAMIAGKVVMRRTVRSLAIAPHYLPAWFQAIQGIGPLDIIARMLQVVISQLAATILVSSLGMFFFPISTPSCRVTSGDTTAANTPAAFGIWHYDP